jgi:hypothetical protein
MKRGRRHLGKITGQHFRPQFHLSLLESLTSYGRGGTWRRKWERLKITGGGQGSHNKPIGCGASGAYDPGPDDDEEEVTLGHVFLRILRFPRVRILPMLHVHLYLHVAPTRRTNGRSVASFQKAVVFIKWGILENIVFAFFCICLHWVKYRWYLFWFWQDQIRNTKLEGVFTRVCTVAQKRLLASPCPSVRPSVHMCQHGCHWSDFLEIWCRGDVMKICGENPNWVKVGQKYWALYNKTILLLRAT